MPVHKRAKQRTLLKRKRIVKAVALSPNVALLVKVPPGMAPVVVQKKIDTLQQIVPVPKKEIKKQSWMEYLFGD